MDAYSYIHNVFIGFIALFPVINPIGTAFIVNPFFNGLTRSERRRFVFKIALYTFYLCVITLFSGSWILQLFGLSVPVVKFAGGIMICKIGWEMISGKAPADDNSSGTVDPNKANTLSSKIFFPLTFPITCGAGTISVLFTLSAHGTEKTFSQYMIDVSSILISVIAMCVLVFFMYANTDWLIKKLGPKNEMIVNQIMSFLIFCVGLQIASSGIMGFINT